MIDSAHSPTLPWERVDERSPIAARMAATTARSIVERRFEAGTLLTEADLANELGASRTPAREAMLQLERWSLVRLPPKKGAIVSPLTIEERRDALAVRVMFESDAIAALASRPDDLAELGTRIQTDLQRQHEAIATNDLLAFASADYAFHARIIQSGGNRVVMELLDTLGPRLARLTYLAVTEHPQQISTYLEEHTRLAECALSGNWSGFATRIRQHINAAHFGAGA